MSKIPSGIESKIVTQQLKGKAIPVKNRTSLENPRNFMIAGM
jgi:hypothetical protein